ncbi:hypothetical protein JL722_11417 [Aureococcus anophagefferens]|nr:hypothetical protein JL722_11417 [Aureococcus anophagefferens]
MSSGDAPADDTANWRDKNLADKKKEYEVKKARAKALKLRLTCTICGEKAKLNCPCGTTQCAPGACDARERVGGGSTRPPGRAVTRDPTASSPMEILARPGSFALVADALVALHKCDPSAWPPKAPRALVDAVSAAPPVFCGPLAVRLDIDEDWTACDEAKLYGVTFEGDALSMAMLCIGDLKVKLGVDCRVVEPKPGADYDFALETDGATARRGWVAAGSMLMRADDNRRWVDALRRTQAAHADLFARLRAISGSRCPV